MLDSLNCQILNCKLTMHNNTCILHMVVKCICEECSGGVNSPQTIARAVIENSLVKVLLKHYFCVASSLQRNCCGVRRAK